MRHKMLLLVFAALLGSTSLLISCDDAKKEAAPQEPAPTVTPEEPAKDLSKIDTDLDGVFDDKDNCLEVANADQLDTDQDLMGNLCDSDDDNDGMPDAADNCPLALNAGMDQADFDGDKIGDLCDRDVDGDRVADAQDNCLRLKSSDQSDIDGDGLGGPCDEDRDGDRVKNDIETDSSLFGGITYNPDDASSYPEDLDLDGIYNDIDLDVDGDDVLAAGGDCDDWDRNIKPGAADNIEDNKDTNCDGIPGDANTAVFVAPGPLG